eukprot:gene33632-40683_t
MALLPVSGFPFSAVSFGAFSAPSAGQLEATYSCYDGAYQVALPPFGPCSGFRTCLNSPLCSGPCEAGFYCPEGTRNSSSFPCGHAEVYCPTGSSNPLPVPAGYYSIDVNGKDVAATANMRSGVAECPFGHYCQRGVKQPCPGGRYGVTTGLVSPNCSDICPGGFYCPPASIRPFDRPCPLDGAALLTFLGEKGLGGRGEGAVYCPPGSPRPLPVGEGYYVVQEEAPEGGGYTSQLPCPPGTYCTRGQRFPCPAGRWGGRSQLTGPQCSGECRSGFYCPEGSILSSFSACGPPSVFCPPASAQPTPVSPGWYTVGSNLNVTLPLPPPSNLSLPRTRPLDGNLLVLGGRTSQQICERGYYCLPDGIRRPCPAGRYGGELGVSSAQCSGPCEGGHYCPTTSTSPRERVCGDVTLFCPAGSARPQTVRSGYYTVGEGGEEGGVEIGVAGPGQGGDEAQRWAERQCPPGFYCVQGRRHLCRAGFWGGEWGAVIDTCSGPCDAGYYCPEGSTSPRQFLCGDSERY